jgi:hypothetical protein
MADIRPDRLMTLSVRTEVGRKSTTKCDLLTSVKALSLPFRTLLTARKTTSVPEHNDITVRNTINVCCNFVTKLGIHSLIGFPAGTNPKYLGSMGF